MMRLDASRSGVPQAEAAGVKNGKDAETFWLKPARR